MVVCVGGGDAQSTMAEKEIALERGERRARARRSGTCSMQRRYRLTRAQEEESQERGRNAGTREEEQSRKKRDQLLPTKPDM